MIAHLESDAATPTAFVQSFSFTITADIEFGTLNRDGDCVNVGICRMQPNVRPELAARRRCHHALAHLSVGELGNLRMFFPRKGMKPCTERAFFSPWLFPVPVACVVPEVLVRQLEGLQQTILPPGTYAIRRSEKGFWVEF